jgi:hypothetical protein
LAGWRKILNLASKNVPILQTRYSFREFKTRVIVASVNKRIKLFLIPPVLVKVFVPILTDLLQAFFQFLSRLPVNAELNGSSSRLFEGVSQLQYPHFGERCAEDLQPDRKLSANLSAWN